jgi:tRNA pseudouridine55 synthase
VKEPRDFVLPVDKPEGPTSHDVVSAARRALGTRRVGHTGTLDPFASGLLLLCVGRATRLAEYLSGLDKTYEATAVLGTTTDTLDREGQVVETNEAWTAVDERDVARALEGFLGDLEQVPPQFSAKKVGGVAMHRRARRGERVQLAPCEVTIYRIELVEVTLPSVRFRVHCSSGTYMRAIARDLGTALGVGAHLSRLRRTTIGGFEVDAAVALDALDDTAQVEEACVELLPALAHLPVLEVDRETAGRLVHGQRLRLEKNDPSSGLVAAATDGSLVAVVEVADGLLRPRKVFPR